MRSARLMCEWVLYGCLSAKKEIGILNIDLMTYQLLKEQAISQSSSTFSFCLKTEKQRDCPPPVCPVFMCMR